MSTPTEPAANLSPSPARGQQWPLIAPEEPPPFRIVNEEGDAPFLLVCDHASRRIPASLQGLGLAEQILQRHVACDIGAEQVTLALAQRFNAPAVLASYSRLIVDLNRQLHDDSAFARESDGIPIPGNSNLSASDRQARIESFFEPYHAAVHAQLQRFTVRGQVPALLSIHSFTPAMNGFQRPWHIGIMWDKDPRIAQPLIARLSAQDGMCVGDNEPYSGAHLNDYTVDVHAEQQGFPCVGVEFRQDLVATTTLAQNWAQRFGDAIAPILEDPQLYERRA